MESITSTRPAYVYALVDPRDGMIRYVGITAGRLRDRLSSHISDARKPDARTAMHWLYALLAEGLTPEMIVLEEVPLGRGRRRSGIGPLRRAEEEWGNRLADHGCLLTNDDNWTRRAQAPRAQPDDYPSRIVRREAPAPAVTVRDEALDSPVVVREERSERPKVWHITAKNGGRSIGFVAVDRQDEQRVRDRRS